jgi:LCP family protein required for cell wall assembly
VNTTRGIKALTVLSVSVVLVSAFSWLALGQVSGSIKRIDVFGKLDSRPEKTSKALNYLIVGSDTREGLTKEQMKILRVGSTKTAAGGRSDTMLLVHISKARDKAMIVSLPRDSLVTIPAHRSSDGTKDIAAAKSKINAAFAWGGAPLLIETVELATNLRIDHYIEVNFAGFAGIVDALGGIEVCTKKTLMILRATLCLPLESIRLTELNRSSMSELAALMGSEILVACNVSNNL